MTWLRPDEAAAALGVTIPTVRVIAHRHSWRRIRIGIAVVYHLDDVADTEGRRAKDAGETNYTGVTSET